MDDKQVTANREAEIAAAYLTRNPDGSWTGAIELARRFGTNHKMIYDVLKRQGVETRSMSVAQKGKPSKKLKRIPPPGEVAPFCRCGCGQPTRWLRLKNRWAYYVTGHYTQRGTQNHSWMGDDALLNAEGFAELTCPTCGKVFHRPAKEHTQTYCSVGCMTETRRSPHYDGNSRWVHWDSVRKRIRKRDNWTCQDCGHVGKGQKRIMHVHHIDENPMNNADANLVLLCLDCHHLRHGIGTPADWPEQVHE